MKWLRLIFILSLPFLVVGLIGWQRGGACDDACPATGTYDEGEYRVDTVSSLWDIYMRPWSGTAVVVIHNANEDAYSKLDIINEWTATPIFCEGDSVYLDSIVIYGEATLMDANDTLIAKIKEPATPLAGYTTITTTSQKIPGPFNGNVNFTFDTDLAMGPGDKFKYSLLLKYHYKSDAHDFRWGHTVYCYTSFNRYKW